MYYLAPVMSLPCFTFLWQSLVKLIFALASQLADVATSHSIMSNGRPTVTVLAMHAWADWLFDCYTAKPEVKMTVCDGPDGSR